MVPWCDTFSTPESSALGQTLIMYMFKKSFFSDYSSPPSGKLFGDPKNIDDILSKMNCKYSCLHIRFCRQGKVHFYENARV